MDNVLDATYRAVRFFTDKILGYFAATVMLSATGLALLEIFRRYVIGVTFQWGRRHGARTWRCRPFSIC